MYRLIVVAGPNLGSSFVVGSGETTIGRRSGNTIVLPSNRVSKAHCAIDLIDGEAHLRDLGSSNGTFVNGVLVRSKKLRPGDRLGIGEFVFELRDPRSPGAGASRPPVAPGGALRPDARELTGLELPPPSLAASPAPALGPMGQASEAEPRDALGRLLLAFDRLVMPIFYRMNLKTDARAIVAGVVLGAVGLTAVLTVGPLTEANRQVAVTQAGRLATHIAREIAHRNSGFVAAGEFGKVDFGIATQSRSVRLAMLVDPSGRILAPARRANQLLSAGRESEIIIGALRGYTRGTNDSGVLFPVDPVTLLAVEPVRVLDSRLGRNVVAAASVVLLDLGGVEALGGDTGMLYSEALIYAGIIGLIAFLILIRLFLKPFEVLNEDIDRVLKGELPQVTHEFRFSPLDPLWDVINSALQRIPRSGGAGAGGGTNSLGLFSGAADPLAPIRALARATPLGMVVFDGERKVQLLNSPFEDLSGIRQDVALGKELGEVARDSALGVFVTDLLDRASAQGEAAESYEFSGVSYRLLAGALGSSPGKPEGYFLSAARGEG